MQQLDPTRFEFDDAITRHELAGLAIDSRVRVLQASAPVNEATWDLLDNEFFAQRPDVQLRIYGHYEAECDLAFARRMTHVRHFTADGLSEAKNVHSIAGMANLASLSLDIYTLPDFSVLELVPSELTDLGLGETRSKKPDLAPLARFGSLQALYLAKQHKNIEVLANLSTLGKLVLRSITTPDLSYLAPLTRLRSITISLGGIRSFAGLHGSANIQSLELFQIRELAAVDIIGDLPGLQELRLDSPPRITTLPDRSRAESLRSVTLIRLKGLADFSALEYAPVLKEFALYDGRAQEPAQLLPVLRNPSVEQVDAGFGSGRKNVQFAALRESFGKAELRRHAFGLPERDAAPTVD